MRKPDFCISENKDADQLRGNRDSNTFSYLVISVDSLAIFDSAKAEDCTTAGTGDWSSFTKGSTAPWACSRALHSGLSPARLPRAQAH